MSSAAAKISARLQERIDSHISEEKELIKTSLSDHKRSSVSVPTLNRPVEYTGGLLPPSDESQALSANNQLLSEVIQHLSEERMALHEQEMHFEVERFREKITEKAVQSQLEELQLKIRDHQYKQEQQAQIDRLHEQQHKRRREKLQKMIEDLQSELEAELLAESQYQAFKLRQQKESMEMFKQFDTDIKKVRDRIKKSSKPREKDREEQENNNSKRMVKIQKLYAHTVQQQGKNQLNKNRALPPTPSVAPKIPLSSSSGATGKRSSVAVTKPPPKPTISDDSPLAKAYVVTVPSIPMYGCMPLSNSGA